MVHATPQGDLKNIIQNEAKAAKLRVKIVERAGPKLSSYLKRFDQTQKKGPCKEKDCLICQNTESKTRKCRIPSIVYKVTCLECEKQNVKANYYGETSFNGYTRGIQHQNKYKSKSKSQQEKSFMRKHAKEVHNDRKVKFKMDVEQKSFKNNPLQRQVYESILIVKSKEEDHYPLNDKNEFNQALIVTTKYTRGVH